MESEAKAVATSGFDLDAAIDEDFTAPVCPESPLTLEDLDSIIRSGDALPPGIEVKPMGHREYSYLSPGLSERLRITTDTGYYEQHSDSVELWSAGNPLFPSPDE